MDQALKILTERCSTKKFLDKPVPEELLDRILDAGLYAASGMNNQKAIMVAVCDKQTRDLLSKLNGEIRGTDGDMFYGAPCVIVVLSDPNHNTWVEDGSLVLGNLMNAATALGLGSCWIHRARETFDSPEGKALLRQWGLPETLRGVGNCVLGYPDGEPVKKPRAPGRILKVD